jgi:hypothetical protein
VVLPRQWETRVLANPEGYHRNVQSALQACRAGDIKPITLAASSYGGLSKDLDGYHMQWMLEPDQVAVDEGIDRVVSVADRIHRLSYDELERAGRL